MAVRIFLARSSVLMRAIKRSWDLHLVQTTSIPKVGRKSSDQEIYFEVFLGLPLSSAGAGAAGPSRAPSRAGAEPMSICARRESPEPPVAVRGRATAGRRHQACPWCQ